MAVTANIGHPFVVQRSHHLGGRCASRSQPATAPDRAVAHIEGCHEALRPVHLDDLAGQVRRSQQRAAQHHTTGTRRQRSRDRFEVTQSAGDLARDGHRGNQASHQLGLHGCTLARTIEVDHVQASGTLRHPARGRREWIAVVGHPAEVALGQPDGTAIEQVDGGDQFHGLRVS